MYLTRFILSAGALSLASGMAEAQSYSCPDFRGADVRITLIEGTDAAVAEFIVRADNPTGGADPVTLREVRGSDGIAYAGGDLLLRGSKELPELTAGDLAVTCTLEGAQTEPAPAAQPVETLEENEASEAPSAPPADTPAEDVTEGVTPDPVADPVAETAPDAPEGTIPALSLGGNLRAGPGTEFEDVGGLDAGTAIALQSDTGVAFNGYNWWQIVLPSGEIAFQWGGVICVPDGGVAGVVADADLCTPNAPAATAETAPAPQIVNSNGIPALSLGGNLRSGPGTAFPDIGDAAAGTEITLITDSGIPFNGYNWWEVGLPNGETAFHWGGVICAPSGGVAGILESCE
ncbi:hypothetical protein [Gymnodinialimonas ulvae]|uniref:hypothetical protein n=1 Tax=Gymnodinialimonas ulvae TaxID=3126504 RepID=UPI0030AA1092